MMYACAVAIKRHVLDCSDAKTEEIKPIALIMVELCLVKGIGSSVIQLV